MRVPRATEKSLSSEQSKAFNRQPLKNVFII